MQGLGKAVAGVLLLSPDTLILRLADADHWTLLFWRGVFTAIAYLILTALLPRRVPLRQLFRMSPAGLAAAILFASGSVFFVVSVGLTSVANTLVIISAGPLFAAAFSALFAREYIPPRTWIATLVGCAGLAVVFSGQLSGGALIGNLCALGAACSLAGTFVLMRHARAGQTLPSLTLSSVLVALVVTPLAAPGDIDTPGLSIMAILCLVLLPVSLLLIMQATRQIPAPEVHLVLLVEALLGPLWVWLALGEVPPGATVAGGALLLATLTAHSVIGLRAARTATARESL